MSALASLQVDSLLSYAAAIVFPALDAVLPVLPSETIVIALGVATAGSADPRIALLVACAAAGAFLGDNLCYVLGRRFGPWIDRRFFRSEKGAKQRAWAIRSLERYGIPLIVACRFIPGGRTAVMLSCGIVRYDRRRFIIATAIAGVIWACYAFFIGRLGGKAFEDKPWAGLLLAFGGTLAISALIELVRRLRARWVQRRAAAQGQDDAQGHAARDGTPPTCRARATRRARATTGSAARHRRMMPREPRSGSSSLRDRLREAHRTGWSGVQAQETRQPLRHHP